MELVLIRGLPGSGKTTMARVLALVGYEHHEADHYFERDGAYKFDPADLPKVHQACAFGRSAEGACLVLGARKEQHCSRRPVRGCEHVHAALGNAALHGCRQSCWGAGARDRSAGGMGELPRRAG